MSLVTDMVVRVHFDDETSLDITAPMIRSFTMLSELDDSLQKLVGNISANELTLTVANRGSILSPTNEESPYYGLIKEDIKIEVINGESKLGVYYVKDWKPNNTATLQTVSIRAVDRLQSVLNSPVGLVGINSLVPLGDYIKLVFQSVGIPETDLDIDPTLSQVLDYTIASGVKLASLLNDLSLCGFCYIYVNNEGKIVVRSRDITGDPVHIIRGDGSTPGNMTSVSPAQSMLSTGNVLRLSYSTPTPSEVKELTKLKGVVVQPGDFPIENYQVNGGNLFEFDHVRVESAQGVTVEDVSFTRTDVSLLLNNPSYEEATCDLWYYGRTVDLSNTYIERVNSELVAKNGRKELTLKCPLVQNRYTAEGLIEKFWTLFNLDVPYLQTRVRSEGFIFNLGDICNVVDESRKLDFKGYIHSINYEWRMGDLVISQLGLKAIPYEDVEDEE